MKLNIVCNSEVLKNLFIFTILIIICYSNSFKFSSDPDDLIIKFNVENVKFKNRNYVNHLKNKIIKEMRRIEKNLNFMKRGDNLDSNSQLKIWEFVNTTNPMNTTNPPEFDEFNDQNKEFSQYEEKDNIKKIPKFPLTNIKIKNSSNVYTDDINQLKDLIYDVNTQNITFGYSNFNENNIEKKKILKFFISTLLECNVMINETISYKTPNKIKSMVHYLNTDKETRISPIGVYSTLGNVDYFAFQRSTGTFKIDFMEELNSDLKRNNTENSKEKKFFRNIENSPIIEDEDLSYRKNYENNFNKMNNYEIPYRDIYKDDDSKNVNENNIKKFLSEKNNEKIGNPLEKKIIRELDDTKLYKNKATDNKLKTKRASLNKLTDNIHSTVDSSFGKNVISTKSIDFNVEYIYDAKHLIHSYSDFRSTPKFNNISFNYDRIIWNLKNENSDKSDENIKIEYFFDMEENFYSENIFLNLNFSKTIFLLDQKEKKALEDNHKKIDSNMILEISNYSYCNDSVLLTSNYINTSPSLNRIKNYRYNLNMDYKKTDLIKIMKIEANKILKFNETFPLEIRFPLYFENCRNYKTNTIYTITGIILMIFLGSILYLIVSLNFSDKD